MAADRKALRPTLRRHGRLHCCLLPVRQLWLNRLTFGIRVGIATSESELCPNRLSGPPKFWEGAALASVTASSLAALRWKGQLQSLPIPFSFAAFRPITAEPSPRRASRDIPIEPAAWSSAQLRRGLRTVVRPGISDPELEGSPRAQQLSGIRIEHAKVCGSVKAIRSERIPEGVAGRSRLSVETLGRGE
jgi:hypothetical protein